MRALAITILMGFMIALMHFAGAGGSDLMTQAILSFGFLIFAGYLAGCYTMRIGLPQITGYLIAGILCGPYVLGLVSHDAVLQLRLVDDLALALIAFTAGGEIRLRMLGRKGLGILSITLFQSIAVFALVAGGLFIMFLKLPFLSPAPSDLAAAAIFFGVIAAANSPATAIAVIVETRARGRVTDITIGVTVIKDVLVLLGFAIALAVAFALSSGGDVDVSLVGDVFLEIVESIGVGAAVAGIVALYLRFVREEFVLFMVTISFIIIFASEIFHLHFLLVCLVTGFLVENFTNLGERLVQAVERTSMTIYIVFFAIAGVAINFSAMRQMWPLALIFVILRMGGTAVGTSLGGFMSGEDSIVRRHGWLGFIGQAGVSLGMASLVARAFPEWGPTFRTTIIAAIAINQIIGPVTLKLLLNRAGETAERHIIEGMLPALRRRRFPEGEQ